ncbi:MAG: hypothetical protein Q8R16_00280 [bacterium]|nr:hypothetical protein [bacterium]
MERNARVFGFRNASHFWWFIWTFTALVVNWRDHAPVPTLALFVCAHAAVAIAAWRAIFVERRANLAFSTDCIWYNGALAVEYLAISVLR